MEQSLLEFKQEIECHCRHHNSSNCVGYIASNCFCRLKSLTHWLYTSWTWTFQSVRVRVTLQLTVSQSVCLGVESNLGLLIRDLFFFFWKLLSCHLGAFSDEMSGLSFVSPLAIQSKIVSVFTYKIYNDIYISERTATFISTLRINKCC
jgi:hypothetical protein